MTPLSAPLIHMPRGALPVLLSVPHSGRDYPDWLLKTASGGQASLEALSDPLVDRLAWRALQHGVGAVIARAPRAAVDCNRAEDEVDPTIIAGPRRGRATARARGGLGIIPARTQQHGYLWRQAVTADELELRLEQAHRPYHRAIEDQLRLLVDRFGCALLLDCHSMPPPPSGVAPVVIGDCHGRSAAPSVTRQAVAIVTQHGFACGLNDPFAGGHVIERHGAPERGVHAIQLELDRRCYLNDSLTAAGKGFDRLSALVEALATGIGQTLRDAPYATAAE